LGTHCDEKAKGITGRNEAERAWEAGKSERLSFKLSRELTFDSNVLSWDAMVDGLRVRGTVAPIDEMDACHHPLGEVQPGDEGAG
jgi:hypothetical protein